MKHTARFFRIEVWPEGSPIYIPAADRFHNLRDGHGIVIDGTLFCTDADEAKAREMMEACNA